MQRCERCALFSFLISLLLFSFSFSSSSCRAEEPPAVQDLITELRWDNLETCQEDQDEQDPRVACLSDKQPRSDRELGMHIFHLAPGESLRFQLAPFTFLRVFSAEKKLTDDALHCLLSNGSGLQTKVSPLRTKDKKNLLIKAVAPLIVQLTRPAQGSSQRSPQGAPQESQEDLSFAVFVSRTRTLPATLDTAEVLPLSGDSFSVEDAGTQHSFWPISADQEAALEEEIEGPARLVLETRLVYPPWYQQQSQSYQVELSGEKIAPTLFLIRTTTDEDRLLLAEEDPAVLGQLRRRYLHIPKGRHRLHLQASQDIQARLIRLDRDAYLFPGRNRVAHDQRQDKQDNDEQAEDKKSKRPLPSWNSPWSSSWNYDEEQLQSLVAEQLIPEQVFPIAQTLIRDYRHSDSPLLAAQLLSNMQDQDKSRQHREEAQQLIHAASFYQHLFPASQTRGRRGGQITQEFKRYLLPKLKGRREGQLVLAEQFGEALSNAVGRGYFFDLTPLETSPDTPSAASPDTKDENAQADKPSNELHFQLPDQPTPYSLRILVQHLPGSPAKPLSFSLITDTGVEQEFTLLPHQERPDTAYRITRAEAGALAEYLNLPRKRQTEPQHPLIKAASYDLVLPAQVKEIYLRPKKGNKTALSLALKMRKARPFLLSQEEFLAADLAAGSSQTSFADLNALIASWPALPKIKAKSSLKKSLRLDRLSQYIFLVRAMKSLSAHIPASVVPLSIALSPLKHKDLPNKQKKKQTKILAKARAAQKSGDWLLALDLWSRAIDKAEENSVNEIRLGQAEALIQLGELNMARTLLRGLLLYPQGRQNTQKEDLSQAAFKRLEAFYQDRQEDSALLSLYAVRFLHKPEQNVLQKFADQALQRGQFDLALFASLILKPEERNHGTLIRAALHKGWSEVARQEISMLSRPEDTEEQRYWQALLEPGSAQPLQVTQPELPQIEPWLIRSHAGQALLYNPSRDLSSQYFLTSPEKPLILDVQGPVQLNLTARPVHRSVDSRVDDWLEIRQGKNMQVLPINKNGPATGLIFRENSQDESGRLPGRAVRTSYAVSSGKHKVIITGRATELMVQVAALRSEPPEIHPQTQNKQAGDSLSCFGEDCLVLHNHSKDSLRSWSASRLRHILANIMEEEMRRPDAAELAPHPDRAGGSRNITSPPLPPSALLLTVDQEEEELLALTKRCTQQKQQNKKQQDKDPLLCMTALVRLGERFPEQKKLAAVQAEMLRLTHPDQPELIALASRLVQSGGWQAAHFVNSEEGIRFITESQEWRPESPALAHRKALLGLHQEEQILFDKKPLVLDMDNLHRTKFTITLTLAEIPYAPPRPLRLNIQVDRAAAESLLLSQQQPVQKKTLHLGKGHHKVSIQLAERSANQFLRVRLHEVHRHEHGADQEADSTASTERSWYVSSRKYPVQVRIQGPGLLWAVETTGGGSDQRKHERKSSYHLVRKGWQEIVLAPSSGNRSLFRVFQRVSGGNSALKSMPEQEQQISFPAPLFSLDSVHPDSVSLRDGYPLGVQEGGSWAWGAGLYRRKAQEDTDDEATEDFFQLTGAYRFYRETYEEYFKTKGLIRFLDEGGTVFGLGQSYRRLLDQRPFSLTAAADFLMQIPESEVSESEILESNNQGSTAMSLHLRTALAGKYQLAGKTWHVPSVSAFARWMTPDGSDRVGQNIDQDIYTQYKEDHRYGMAFSETLHYRPRLDTQFSTGLRLATNENLFSPDYLRFRCRLRQLIWPFQADLAYTGTYYFNDTDREEDILKNSISLDLTADHWQQTQRRLRLGLRLRTDLDTGEQSGFLYFSWIFSKSRGVRDFQPAELPFKSLRERMLFDTENNTIQYE